MPAGNRSILVILDSRCGSQRRMADNTVFAALDHFGVAWEVLDSGDYWALPPGHVAPRAAYVIAHDGAGAGLKPEVAREIAEAVVQGAGLVSFDRNLEQWPDDLRALLPAALEQEHTGILQVSADGGFIAFGHPQGEAIELAQELAVTTFAADDTWEALLGTPQGKCVIGRRHAGEGRMVVFGTGERLYSDDYLGHVRGCDGLMWRSLVWAAAKPFPMRCLPPYVTARMDDCNGTYSAFQYVEVMNRFGIAPNLGLFTDEMGPSDWAAVTRLYKQGGADFSMHAFRDDFYMTRPDYKPYAVSPDKPDLSKGGTETLFEGLSLDHETGRDLPAKTIHRNFQRMDDAFARAGIRHSRVLNAHFGEVGWRAVPYFLDRGVDMPCNNSAFGQLYGNQPVWRPRPYCIRGTSGRHGLVIDRCPQHPEFVFISMTVSHVGKTHMTSDILSGRVPFLGESEQPKIKEATEAGIRNIKLGVDALAFGLLMTHEERINAISLDDWETIVTGITAGLDDWDVQYSGREQVGVACKRLFDSQLVWANLTERGLECELCGQTGGPSPLTVWDNDGDECRRTVVEVAEIDGFTEICLKLPL